MEKKQSVQSVQKARTIASFVKKNQFFVQFSNNDLAYFLCQELSKCNSDRYTYRIDNVEISFFLYSYNDDKRKGGYLCCNIWDKGNWDVKWVFNSFEQGVEYNDKDTYLLSDVVFNKYRNREEYRTTLFQWDKIIECMG